MKIAVVLAPSWNILLPSLGITSVYTFLKKEGFDVTLFDFNIDFYKRCLKQRYNPFKKFKQFLHFKFFYLFNYRSPDERINKLKEINQEVINEWAEELLKMNFDIVCFSCYSLCTPASLKIAERIKELNNKIITIFGGPDCALTMSGKDIIKKEFVDFMIPYEGELVISLLLNALREGKKVKSLPGVVYKSKNHIFFSKNCDLIKNLDSLPFLDLSSFNLQDYKGGVLPISFSRGCPHNCGFCHEKRFWKMFRYKSADRIIKELSFMEKKYNNSKFWVQDSLMNGNPILLENLCDKIIEKRLNISWSGWCRVNKNLTLPFLKKLNKAGCKSINYGLESGSSKVLKDIGKEYDIKTIEEIIKNTYNAGIRIDSSWITGFPTERFKDFLRTLEFIWKNRKYLNGRIDISSCIVLSGTPIYDNHEVYGIENHEKKRHWKRKNLSFTNRLMRYFILSTYIKIIKHIRKF